MENLYSWFKRVLLGSSVLFISSFISAGVLLAQSAALTTSDFDSDGLTDLTLVKIGSGGALSWSYVSSSTGIQSTLTTFGENGNHIIMAPWRCNSRPDIGVVALNSGDINWKILDEQGSPQSRLLGDRDHVVVAGADFNGNGCADAAVVKLKKGRAVWQFKIDPFADLGQDPVISQATFGKNGDRVFFANADGLAADWVGIVRRSKTQKSVVRFKNISSGQVLSSKKFPAVFSGGSRPRPFAVRQGNGQPDLIAVQSGGSKSATPILFYTATGIRVAQYTLPGNGTVTVGNYLSDPGEEVAIQTSTGFSILNPVTGTQKAVIAGDGIPVDQININTFSSGGGGGGGGSGGGGGGGGTDNPPVSGEGCKSVKSWPGSHIYKTVGSSHFTDIRRNTIGVIVKPGGVGPFPSCIIVMDTKGNALAQAGLYARGNGWEARYYAGIGCGSSTPFNGATIGAKARANTGSSQVLMNFGSVCYGPIDATRCIGSSQC